MKYDPDRKDIIDLQSQDPDEGMMTFLDCVNCEKNVEAGRGGIVTHPIREKDDPNTVVRCAECGRKHSTDSLIIVDIRKCRNCGEDVVIPEDKTVAVHERIFCSDKCNKEWRQDINDT
ncbi:MAG: hypothetical protein ABEK59_01285 [Halobacteria archaeon]